MTSTTQSDQNSGATAGTLIDPVLADLESVVGAVTPGQFDQPTPCPGFDVAALRQHILGWLTHFALALNDPDGRTTRPDPAAFEAPADAEQAAAVVAAARDQIATAVASGVAEQPVLMVEASMPGEGVLTMALWEYLMHGHDLAAATGQPWTPPEQAAQTALGFAGGMLTDQYRGPDKDFGPVVPVPEDAPALDRLLGFSGRQPHWTPPAT